MDKLVAQYSGSSHQNEMYSEQEQQDITASVPPLSLKFSLPPVDNVRFYKHQGGLSSDEMVPFCGVIESHLMPTQAALPSHNIAS